jgi:hypothetical protein
MGPVPRKAGPLYAGVVHFRLPGSGPIGRGGRGGMGPVPLPAKLDDANTPRTILLSFREYIVSS